MELEPLQHLLYRLITAPGGVEEGLAAEPSPGAGGLAAVIRGDERLSPAERVGIYANMYFYRLLDVLREDFPATLAVLGDDHFHNLVTGYLLEFPATEPSIMYAGRYLAAFLHDHPFAEQLPFLAELATLERTLIEIFHAVNAISLDAAAMNAIPPLEWPRLMMRRHPASRIVELDWRVDQLLRTVERGEPWCMPQREPVKILVWRRDAQVFYRALELDELQALTFAEGGASFAAICEAVAAASSDPTPAARINRLLGVWLAHGLLTRDAPGAAA
jgi:hypothetical protein